ncbi:hypothetical protein GGF46_003345 [Coemansia sp. RSA 552]|nr:hypothetical protein GGF46_003345 [Coemansia sp. RSA 552]
MLETDGRPASQCVPSDDDNNEFYDCKSNPSSSKASIEAAGVARQSSNSNSSDVRLLSPRLRRLTSTSSVGGSGSLANDTAAAPGTTAPLRRSSTTRASSLSSLRPESHGASRLVEERARRAIRAMAEACTTGISVREADERRERVFSRVPSRDRRANGSSREGLAPRQLPLHHVSSHGRISGAISASNRDPDQIEGCGSSHSSGERPMATSVTPEPDGRARSLTGDKKAAATVHSASLEARVDRTTRVHLRRWIMCFGTVHFDVDQGPTLHLLYPHLPFSTSEQAAICFSSMPDSTIYELCDSVYTFNFRVDPVRLGLPKDQIFLHGHVFFRQKRDPLMRRGGFQRSVVIISHLPYHGLFARLAHVLGPLYFDLGTTILETAAHNIASWPSPEPGHAYELPFLGSALSVELPTSNASQLLETSKFPLDKFNPGEHILAGISCDGLFRSFRDTLSDLWVCWELMILGESLVVLADDPSRCSEAVVGLVDTIFPIRYCGDYRPYFTIQDPDFRAIVSKTHVPPNTVVGVSNPFFSEALSHWPHKLFLGTSGRMSQMHGATVRKKAAATGDGAGDNGSNAAGTGSRATLGAPARPDGIKQGLQSKHKCAVNKDRPFADQLLHALRTGKQTPWTINNMLRRYFIDLTMQFLAPLDRYFSTLIPIVQSSVAVPASAAKQHAAPWSYARQRGVSFTEGSPSPTSLSWAAPPGPLRPWRTCDFLASLESFGISPQLSSRYQKAMAADALASVFSGSGSSAGGSSANCKAGGAGSGRGPAAPGANPPQATSFLPWTAKKGSRRISDEWLQLYTQFLKCGNFATWLAHRTNEAQHALLTRFRQELCRGDMHAWCRGYDYPLDLSEHQLAAEIELLDLATMDLGQGSGASALRPHVQHVFYHGQAEDERARAEQRRRQMLREQQARLASSERPVYGSDGTLVGYTRRGSARDPAARPPARGAGPQTQHQQQQQQQAQATMHKQLGQRITHARRAQHALLQAAWQIAELAGCAALAQVPPARRPRSSGGGGSGSSGSSGSAIDFGAEQGAPPPAPAERAALLRQLSILLEYMPAETGCLLAPLVAADYPHARVESD